MAIKIHYLGWSAFILTFDNGMRFLIDPMLEGDEKTGIPKTVLQADELGSIDYVLVSHGSYDHLGQAIEITKQYKTKLICCADVKFHALRRGVPKDDIINFIAGAVHKVNGIKIKGVSAAHCSITRSGDEILWGPPVGFVIRNEDNETVYFPGDTALMYDLKMIREVYRPDVIMVGIGGANFDGGHIMRELEPYEGAIMCDWTGAEVAIPFHYLDDKDVEEFIEHTRYHSPFTKVIPMKPGEEYIYMKNKV